MKPERETCPSCHGDGVKPTRSHGSMSDQTFAPPKPCRVCGGRGTVEKNKP